MSATVDTRIVEMMFNNKQFETGIKQSSGSLEKLKKGLDLRGASRNLSNLSAQGSKFSLANIGESVGNIASKFSAFGVIGFAVLQRLTNAAIDFGKKIVSGILQPIQMGFSEYETQINAIQTVLANTEAAGTTLKDVSAALAELNTYADQTIYNFTEMTRNIGTFTAAGVDLDTSVAAIKGIANLAAVSGSTSQQASTAMYQLSQALSSGTVKLMDWNSVVNAGMGGAVFQNALKETARVSGIAIDELIDKHGSFRETLSTGWLSTDVLLQTLQKFTGDLSKDQLLSMGYAEDQIEAILKLGKMANDAATKVKTFTQLQETLMEALQSGWTQTWELIIGDFDEAKAFFTEVSDTLGGIIGASSEARNNLLKEWKEIGGRTFLIEGIRNAFEGLLTILKPITEALKDVFPPITGLQLAVLTANFASFTEKLKLNEETAKKVKDLFTGIFSIFGILGDVVKGVFSVFSDLGKAIPISGEGVLDFLVNIASMITNFRETVDITKAVRNGLLTFGSILVGIKNRIVAFGKSAIKTFENIKTAFEEWLLKVFGPVDLTDLKASLVGFKDSFTGLFDNLDLSGFQEFVKNFKEKGIHPLQALGIETDGIFQGLADFAAKIPGYLATAAKAIADFLSGILTSLSDGAGGIDFDNLNKLFGQGLVALLGAGLFQLVGTVKDIIGGAADIMEGLADILDNVGGALEAWQQNLKAKTILLIAVAIAILAGSLILLSTVDSEKLVISLGIITGLFVDLMGSLALMSRIEGFGGAKAVLALVGISLALLIMSAALAKLSDLNPEKMGYAVAALTGIVAAMIGIMMFVSRNQINSVKAAGILIGFAFALWLMVGPIKKLGEMDSDALVKGVLAISSLMLAIGVFLRVAGGKSLNLRSAVVILAVAGAINLIAIAVHSMGKMKPDELAKGVGSIIALLAALAAFTNLTGGGDLLATGAGLLLVGGALLILSLALRQIGDLKPDTIYQSLLTIGAALLILVVALNAMTGAIGGAGALLISAAALVVLAYAMERLGKMSLKQIGIALLAMAGAFLILGIAGYALGPIIPVLIGLGAAILLFGVAALLAGVGMLAFGTGLGLLAAGGVAAAAAIFAAIVMLLPLVPMIIQTLIDALIIGAQGIVNAQPIIVEALTALLTALAQVIINVAPEYGKAFTVVILTLLGVLEENVPAIVAGLVGLLLTLVETIAEKVPDFIQAGSDIIVGLLEGIAENAEDITTAGADAIVNFLNGLEAEMPRIVEAAIELGRTFVIQVGMAILSNIAWAISKARKLGTSMVNGLGSAIKAGVSKIKGIIRDLVRKAIAAAMKLLDSHSDSKVFIAIGETVTGGFATGILRTMSKVVKATKMLGEKAIDTMEYAISNVRDLIAGEIAMDPVIKPVIDMTNIVKGGKILDAIFLTPKTLALDAIPVVRGISYGMNARDAIPIYPTEQAGEVNQITFEQNNYSPKALSRIDIYRQTRNQLVELEGLVNS